MDLINIRLNQGNQNGSNIEPTCLLVQDLTGWTEIQSGQAVFK
jgi:hypothetical protein